MSMYLYINYHTHICAQSAADETKKGVLVQREKELLNEIEVLNASCKDLESTISKVKADSEMMLTKEVEARKAVEEELVELKDQLKVEIIIFSTVLTQIMWS